MEKEINEKRAREKNGWVMLAVEILLIAAGIAMFAFGAIYVNDIPAFAVLMVGGMVVLIISIIMLCGFKTLQPNESYVFTLFGKYYGSLKRDGFFWVNPFCSAVNPARATMGVAKKISLKAMTLNNEKQKVNDEEGNPIEISVVVIWRITNTARAVFNVDNYMAYLSTQCDAAIRQVARQYPYDVSSNGDEKSLRGSSQEIADIMCRELQKKTEDAGISIEEVRITHLAYAPEIASAMLQRQQAAAVIDARQKIVEGAVGMVEMALSKLNENDIVELDEERKAAMVSNLLVVLCGNKDAQPIVNSGTLY